MNNLQDIAGIISIGLCVALFLLKTNRALKTIELCKEMLVLLNNKALSIEEQIEEESYEAIYLAMFMAYHQINDITNAIT